MALSNRIRQKKWDSDKDGGKMTSTQSDGHFEALEKTSGEFLAGEERRHAQMVSSEE